MPTIARLAGVKITMYADDEAPPHFHVLSADSSAKIRIDTLEVLAGRLKRTEHARVLAWALANRGVLAKTWRELNERD